MLTKLTYPTGGYSCFEYEPNRFDDEYYYPDAADRFVVSVVGCSANAYGTGGFSHQKKEITVTETTEYSFRVSLYTPDLNRYTAKACLKMRIQVRLLKAIQLLIFRLEVRMATPCD